MTALGIFKYSTRFILKKYYLLDIYEKYCDMIERVYSNINNFTISDDFQGKKRKKAIYTIVQNIIEDEINNTKTESLIEIYKFEQKVYDYKTKNSDDAIILFSKYDVLSALLYDEIKKKDTFVAVRKVNLKIFIKPLKVLDDIQNIIAYC